MMIFFFYNNGSYWALVFLNNTVFNGLLLTTSLQCLWSSSGQHYYILSH